MMLKNKAFPSLSSGNTGCCVKEYHHNNRPVKSNKINMAGDLLLASDKNIIPGF